MEASRYKTKKYGEYLWKYIWKQVIASERILRLTLLEQLRSSERMKVEFYADGLWIIQALQRKLENANMPFTSYEDFQVPLPMQASSDDDHKSDAQKSDGEETGATPTHQTPPPQTNPSVITPYNVTAEGQEPDREESDREATPDKGENWPTLESDDDTTSPDRSDYLPHVPGPVSFVSCGRKIVPRPATEPLWKTWKIRRLASDLPMRKGEKYCNGDKLLSRHNLFVDCSDFSNSNKRQKTLISKGVNCQIETIIKQSGTIIAQCIGIERFKYGKITIEQQDRECFSNESCSARELFRLRLHSLGLVNHFGDILPAADIL